MKKSLAVLLASALSAVAAGPPGIKVSELPAGTNANAQDLVLIVQNPSTSPTTKKLTVAEFLSGQTFSNSTMFNVNMYNPVFAGLDITNLIVSVAGQGSNSIANSFGSGTNTALYSPTVLSNNISIAHGSTNTPYRTIALAIAAAVSNDTIKLSGRFAVSNVPIVLPHYVHLSGPAEIFGRSSLVDDGVMICPGNNSVIEGITVTVDTNQFSPGTYCAPFGVFNDGIGAQQYPGTNWIIRNCRVFKGDTDVFFFSGTNRITGTVYDSYFESGWDAVAMQPTTATPATNSYISFHNCTFRIDGTFGYSPEGRLFQGGEGKVAFFDCEGTITNFPRTTLFENRGGLGNVEVYGGKWTAIARTNGPLVLCSNVFGSTFMVNGSLFNASKEARRISNTWSNIYSGLGSPGTPSMMETWSIPSYFVYGVHDLVSLAKGRFYELVSGDGSPSGFPEVQGQFFRPDTLVALNTTSSNIWASNIFSRILTNASSVSLGNGAFTIASDSSKTIYDYSQEYNKGANTWSNIFRGTGSPGTASLMEKWSIPSTFILGWYDLISLSGGKILELVQGDATLSTVPEAQGQFIRFDAGSISNLAIDAQATVSNLTSRAIVVSNLFIKGPNYTNSATLTHTNPLNAATTPPLLWTNTFGCRATATMAWTFDAELGDILFQIGTFASSGATLTNWQGAIGQKGTVVGSIYHMGYARIGPGEVLNVKTITADGTVTAISGVPPLHIIFE